MTPDKVREIRAAFLRVAEQPMSPYMEGIIATNVMRSILDIPADSEASRRMRALARAALGEE